MIDNSDETVKIDDVVYELNNLSENAKAQLSNISFVDAKIQQLNNELAVADTARIAYAHALKADLEKAKDIE